MTGWKRRHVTETSNLLSSMVNCSIERCSIVTQQTLEVAAEEWMVPSRGVY